MAGDRDDWVHLYEFATDGESSPAAWETLCEEERARARRIADPVRRSRFVARRVALHEILDGYPGGVSFNSSHSKDVAVVAVATFPVGVDIEVDAPRRSQERIARRMFAPDERGLLNAFDGDARRRLFYRCWVAKEAYAKARGRGLAMRFDQFSVASVLDSPDGRGHVDEGWNVALRTRGDRHVAVAAGSGGWELVEVCRG